VVGVALEGERRRGVSGERLQVPDGLAALGEQGEAAMPEVVEPDGGEAGPHEQRLEEPVDDVLRLDGAAREVGEHEAALPPFCAGP
jgi:hypothetical protein